MVGKEVFVCRPRQTECNGITCLKVFPEHLGILERVPGTWPAQSVEPHDS